MEAKEQNIKKQKFIRKKVDVFQKSCYTVRRWRTHHDV